MITHWGGGKLTVENITRAGDSPTVDEILACPENSVLSGEYSSEAAFSGISCSDQGRGNGMSMKSYQSFSGCRSVINGVRYLGVFNYYQTDENGESDWVSCNSRGNIDENYNMTEPITVEVSFYETGADGYPGKCVYKEEVDVVGKFTGVIRSGDEPVYSFTVNLKQEVKMYSGFVSFSAVNKGYDPKCWLSLMTSSDVEGVGLILVDGTDFMAGFNPPLYCLLGDSSKPVADKGLTFERVLSPTASENGKYAKAQVEFSNYGSTDISDATFELYEGDKKLATEKVNATIPAGDSYKYTFNQRLDCSTVGTHEFTIKNVTAGDAGLVSDHIDFSVEHTEGLVPSQSGTAEYGYISNVKIGTIDNTSEGSTYSDFRDKKAEIKYGETLPLTVTLGDAMSYLKVWCDWNGDGRFDGKGEFLGYAPELSLDVKIPDGIHVTAGDHVLRIILSADDTASSGAYDYGETEDYTLTVVRTANTPDASADKSQIEATESKSESFAISNNGDAALDAKLSVDYSLPYSPNSNPISKAAKPALKLRKSAAPQKVAAPKADGSDFALKYCKDRYTGIGLASGSEVTYATYYPGKTLASIAGMKISSVDVYIEDTSKKSSIVVYGEKSQSENGKLIATKEFTPVANSWNHVVFDTPITIDGTDLWIGAKFEGLTANSYQIGTDEGPSAVGFGDIVNIGGKTWWSLADLDNDGNLCIKANVTGEKTPAISWLSLDKQSANIETGKSETVKVSIKAEGLEETLYEALIKVETNDPLASTLKIPVYLNRNKQGGISEINEMITAKIFADSNNNIVVKSDKEVEYVAAIDMNGNMVGISYNNTLNLSNASRGVYVVKVVFADGSEEATTVAIK